MDLSTFFSILRLREHDNSPMAGRGNCSPLPSRIFLAVLAVYVLLLLISAIPAGRQPEAPSFSQAPGYADSAPQIGPVRVVPLAKSPMRSPVTQKP